MFSLMTGFASGKIVIIQRCKSFLGPGQRNVDFKDCEINTFQFQPREQREQQKSSLSSYIQHFYDWHQNWPVGVSF